MPHHPVLDERVLEQLRNEVPKEDVLTAVILVNPGHPDNQGGAMFIRAKNAIGALEAPQALKDFVLKDIADAEHARGKSRAYFVWDGGFHTVDVNMDLPERASYGPTDFEALRAALESGPKAAIVLVDHNRGRYFLYRAGELVERRRLENTLENDRAFQVNEFRDVSEAAGARHDRVAHSNTDPTADGGYKVDNPDADYDLFSAQGENQEKLFHKRIAEYAGERHQAGEFTQLLVAGPVKAVTSFKAELSKPLTEALAGEFNVDTSAPASGVLEAARDALDAAAREADRKLIDEARERGVRGVNDTLDAIQQGRVYQVIVAGDGSGVPVWRDTDTDAAYVFGTYPAMGQSPLSGRAVEATTLHDVLPELRDRFGVQVTSVNGDNEDRLRDEMGGIAGLTRF